MKYFKHETAIVHPDAKIGDETRVWAHVHIQAGAQIGSGCNICDGTYIEGGVLIGNQVTIKHNVSIFDGVVIEDDCFIASNIAFINDRNPRSHRSDEWTLEKTIIKKGATLGTNAVLMCGITVGEYGFIGAGSVVLRDVDPFTMVAGNPAKFIHYVCQCGRKLDSSFKCSCGLQYELQQERLKKLN